MSVIFRSADRDAAVEASDKMQDHIENSNIATGLVASMLVIAALTSQAPDAMFEAGLDEICDTLRKVVRTYRMTAKDALS